MLWCQREQDYRKMTKSKIVKLDIALTRVQFSKITLYKMPIKEYDIELYKCLYDITSITFMGNI